MKIDSLNDMIRGWFVGDFEPNVLKSDQVEVGVKSYKKGDYEERHYHKIATEITVITKGKVKMNGVIYSEGDIITIAPFEDTDFEALEDSQNVVVKIPAAKNDKYLGNYGANNE